VKPQRLHDAVDRRLAGGDGAELSTCDVACESKLLLEMVELTAIEAVTS
jgi:hypothetical protein